MFSDKTTSNKQIFGDTVFPNCEIEFYDNKQSYAAINLMISLYGITKNNVLGLNYFIYVKTINIYDTIKRNYLFEINVRDSHELWMTNNTKLWAVLDCFIDHYPCAKIKEWMLLTKLNNENYNEIKKAYETQLFIEKIKKSNIIGEYDIINYTLANNNSFAKEIKLFI